MKTSFINNILNSQPIFDQVCTEIVCVQMPVFSDTFTSWPAFSLKILRMSIIFSSYTRGVNLRHNIDLVNT